MRIFLYYLSLRKIRVLKNVNSQLSFDKKSLYVKHGKTWENFAPFMENYPGEKENSVFLGSPVDFISFDDDSVKFIEVKTGTSKLNNKQKKVRELIENRKVEWYEVRFDK